ncbi:MAG: cadherin-like beta sandwich domain-containing protein [Bacteroidales bacterium]|jgi:endo-1,4-beta-D-glucanase Y|nr:cadherin-like beta sandwich domain-containing protein [Bacteroidales bacterium]
MSLKFNVFIISTLFFVASAYSQIVVEAENMTLGGPYAGTVSSPFDGIALYGNGDNGVITVQFPDGAGIYEVSIIGASNNTTTASVSLYIDSEKKKSFSFTGITPATQTAELRLPDLGTPAEIKIQLETDNGSNDTYIDKITFTYKGAIIILPPPVIHDQGAYYTDIYRNMFVEAGLDSIAVKNKLQALWDHFFYGEENQKLYYEADTDEAYILDVANNDVRSEGMSYGMMICVQMDKQAEFNRLWKWAKTKMQYTSGQYEGYFAWQLNADGTIKGNGPASDGEEYFIMALFFASHRWGDGEGIFNYSFQANEILRHCMRRSDAGGGVTNLFNSTQKQVTFVPYGNSASFTDPSYHLPSFYQLWSYWASDLPRRSFWAECASKSRQMFPLFANETTGLMPDYAEFSGAPRNEGDHKHFQYDAWRCIMNVAIDYAWFKADESEVALVNKIHNFFESKGIDSYGGLYQLNGTVLNNNNDHSPGLVACNATGALASNQSIAWDFINDFYNMSVPSGTYRYYDGMLYFLNYLHLSGNFKIYKPDQDVQLLTLSVSSATGELTLKPLFYSDIFSYTASAANNIESVTIKAAAANGCTVTGDTGTKNLNIGANIFTIIVTKNGYETNTQDYTVKITRASETGAGNDCEILFDFESEVYSGNNVTITSDIDNPYVSEINQSSKCIQVTTVGNYSNSVVGLPVTIPDGLTFGTYFQSISFQLACTGSSLPGKNTYIGYSDNGINWTVADIGEGVTVIGNSWSERTVDVSNSKLENLRNKTGSFYLGVGIKSGAGTEYYMDNVKLTAFPEKCTPVAEIPARLNNLSVSYSGGTLPLTPLFDADKFSYWASVENAVESVTIEAAADSGYTVSGDIGEKILNDGANIFQINVTKDGNETDTCEYTVTITKAGIITQIPTVKTNGQNVNVFANNNEIHIVSDSKILRTYIYNIFGALLYKAENINANNFDLISTDFPEILIVKILTEKRVYNIKTVNRTTNN